MLEIAQAQELLVNTFYETKLKWQGKFLFPTTSYDSNQNRYHAYNLEVYQFGDQLFSIKHWFSWKYPPWWYFFPPS